MRRYTALVSLLMLLAGCAADLPGTPTEHTTLPVQITTAPTEETTLPTTAPTETTVAPTEGKLLVVIDAGHQRQGNYDKEPVGPGAAEMKTKVSSGTQGVVSGLMEYELTLAVSLKLQSELESRGYEVVMIRTTHDVDISNAERAETANQLNADAFIRIHADGHTDPAANGATALCQSPDNPYNAHLHQRSKVLSQALIMAMTASAGCKNRGVQYSDTMSGINWCRVPVSIIELGFMTNPEEDALLATEDYQNKLVQGLADGLDAYFAETS